jgi:hypothetical protein
MEGNVLMALEACPTAYRSTSTLFSLSSSITPSSLAHACLWMQFVYVWRFLECNIQGAREQSVH